MNFSAISYRSVVGKLLRIPLRLIPERTVLPILQGALRGKKWVSGSSDHGCWLGSYEYEKQTLFTKSILPGDVVFDIGAHAGFYTLLASSLVGHGGRVIAFEPLPSNLEHLGAHLRLNNVDNVQVIEAAVSDTDGQFSFKLGDGTTTGSLSPGGELKVRTVSLDTMHAKGDIPIPSAIKMDIEGGEIRALIGAKKILEQHHPIIFLATHSAEIHKNCCELLRSLGYDLRPVAGDDVDATDEIIASYNNS